jgi:2-C-methyl-D-erythritol 4-phosphate cytidylyltransferase
VGGETPKQFLPLADGRSILEHSIDAFEASPCIDEIAVVMHPDHISSLQKLCQTNRWQKLTKIIPGGAERWESSYNAIKAFCSPSLVRVKSSARSDCRWPSVELHGVGLLLHDAARPFVSQRIIADVCQALETHEAVTVAVPSTDTIYITDHSRLVSMPPRETVWRAQTPQAFHLSTIAEAFRRLTNDDNRPSITDDIGIVHHYLPGTSVYIVPGEETNKKITYPEDL